MVRFKLIGLNCWTSFICIEEPVDQSISHDNHGHVEPDFVLWFNDQQLHPSSTILAQTSFHDLAVRIEIADSEWRGKRQVCTDLNQLQFITNIKHFRNTKLSIQASASSRRCIAFRGSIYG